MSAFRKEFGVWAVAGLCFAATAQPAEPLQPLLACRVIEDTAVRLQCFDRESSKLANTNADKPAAANVAPARTRLSPSETFGLGSEVVDQREVAVGARPADLKKIDAHIAAVSSTGTGFTTFTLDNGQVWRQITPEGDLLVKPGDALTISRGVMRSYWLQTKNGRGCKVTRIS